MPAAGAVLSQLELVYPWLPAATPGAAATVGNVHHHELVDVGPVGVILLWLVLGAQREHRLAEDQMRVGYELALARSLQHLKAVAGLVWR
eukprot:3969092-Pleurochrysis_carterae.AAC.1